MEVTARIKLFEATDAAEKLTCAFQEAGNNLCGEVVYSQEDLREGINSFLPYKNEGTGAEADEENSFNRLGLFNILGSDKKYQYRSGITGTKQDMTGNGYRYELNLVAESAEAGKKLYGVVIYGDHAAEQFPMKATYCALNTDADGVETEGTKYIASNENAVFTIKFAEPARKVKISLDYWSRPQYNACVTAVLPLSAYYVLDKHRLISVETKSQMCEDSDEIKYGTLPGDGTIEANDYDGEICELLRNGIISNESVVDICAGDTLVQRQLIASSDYDSEEKTVKFTLGDKLSLFENINYEGMRISKTAKKLIEILQEVMSVAGYGSDEVLAMCNEEICPQGDTVKISVREWLESIVVPFPYLESDNLRETLDKICTAAQLFCYCDVDGEPKFVSARPQSYSDKEIVRIPKERTYGALHEDVFPKLKYDAVESTVTTLTLKKEDEIESTTFDFYDEDSLAYKSDWEKDCDVATAIKFANGAQTDGTPDLVYLEKTFDVEPTVYMNTAHFEAVDKNKEGDDESEISTEIRANKSNVVLKKCNYGDKDSFLSEYYSNGTLVKDPTEKDVVMGYCYNTTKCTVMMFVPVLTGSKYKLSREIKLIADNYEAGEVTNIYSAS